MRWWVWVFLGVHSVMTGQSVKRWTLDGKYSAREAQALAPDRLAMERRLLQLGQTAEATVSDSEVARYMDLLLKEFSSQKAFQALLQELGLSRADVENALKEDLIRFRVLDQIYQEVLPADTDQVEVPEERIYREIYIPAPPYISWWDRWNARLYAWFLWTRLKWGADFETLAQKYSHGRTARLGGIREPIVLDPRNPISRTVFTLEPGAFSTPVETRWGFYLLYLEEIRPAHRARYGDLPWRLKRAVVYQRMKDRLETLTGRKLR